MKLIIIFLSALLLIFGLICFLIFSKTTIEFLYDGKIFRLKIINGFLKIKLNIPENNRSKKNKKSSEDETGRKNPEKRVKDYKNKFNANKNVILTFFRLMRYKIHFSKLLITLDYGCSNAAATGILYGVLWGLVSGIYNTLNLYFNAEYPEVVITPDFQRMKFDISVKGIFRVRLVHIISAIVKIIFLEIKKNKKERGS